MSEHNDILERLNRIADLENELSDILQTVVLNDSTILDALAQMLGAIQKMSTRAEQIQTSVDKSQKDLTEEVRALAAIVSQLSKQTVS